MASLKNPSATSLKNHSATLGSDGTLVRTSTRRTVVVGDAVADLLWRGETISEALAVVVGHAIVGAVEGQSSDTRVALDAGGLLKARGNVLGDLAEDGDLALDDLPLVQLLMWPETLL